MKKIITVLLAFTLSFSLIVSASASIAETFVSIMGTVMNLQFSGSSCKFSWYNTRSPSINATFEDGDSATQLVNYDVLLSLYDEVSVEGINWADNLMYSGTFRLLSSGGYVWLLFNVDDASSAAYISNAMGKMLYAVAPATGDTYTTSPIAGAPGYFVTARPRGTTGSGYAGDLAIPQANYMTILNSLQSLGGSATYYTALAVVDGETRYYMSCVYPSRLVTYVCNSSGQLYYYVKEPAASGDGDTPAPFDDSAVITAINSVYGAISFLGSRIGTLINSVDTISQNLSVHIQNFVSAVTSLRADINGLRESLEYIFAEFTQLYPSDASMTLSPGDTLVWDSATMQEPVLSWEYVGSPYPPIYATGVSGFSGNVGYIDGYFALTPSTGNYFPSVLSVGNGSITMPYELVSSAVPNPAHVVPDGYTQYESISSTGTQYIMLPAVSGYSYNLSFCGGTGISNNLWGSVLDGCIYGSSNVYAGYPEYSANSGYFFNCNSFSTSERNDLSFDTRADTASLNGSSITSYGTPYTSFGGSVYALFGILNSSGNVDRFSTATIYAYSVVSPAGDLLTNLIPCSNPSGEIGMYDTVTGTFLSNSGTGEFVAGAEVPTMISDEVRSYYNITSVFRASSVGSYNQWNALDDGGTMHMLSAADCVLLDDAFTTVTYNSIDSFVPLDGSTLLSWDDSDAYIIIDYKSMSRFFTWNYRFIVGVQNQVRTFIASFVEVVPEILSRLSQAIPMLFLDIMQNVDFSVVLQNIDLPTILVDTGILDALEDFEMPVDFDVVTERLDSLIVSSGSQLSQLNLLNRSTDAILDKLDDIASDSQTSVENVTNIVIDASSDAFNVFYVTNENGEQESIGNVAGDTLSASGKVLQFLFKFCFEGAISGLDGALDDMYNFYYEDAPIATSTDIWS